MCQQEAKNDIVVAGQRFGTVAARVAEGVCERVVRCKKAARGHV